MQKELVKTGLPLTQTHDDCRWNLRCGGRGLCNACRVTLLRGVFRVGDTIINANTIPATANACQTTLLSDTGLIDIPADALLADHGAIATRWIGRPLPPATGDAIAVDLGTTTVAAVLLRDGTPVADASVFNAQARFGDNVISRIAAANTPEKRRQLQDAAIESITACLRELPPSTPNRIAVAGNTVMTSLLWNVDPTPIGVSPFTPLVRHFSPLTAADLRLPCPPQTPVFAVPSIAAYVGGDLTAGLYETDLQPGEMLVDLGTNCEMILNTGSQLLCTAAAAGPAFEGAGIACGRRATPGAIDHFRANFQFSTIGNLPPDGLCGSAMVDLLAVGHQEEWLSDFGRLDLDVIAPRLRRLGNLNALEIAPDVLLTEQDIEQLLKAKAAVAAGVQSLLDYANLTLTDLKRIHLAGGFANFLDLPNAVAIGMLPDCPVSIVGNTSLAGASALALDEHLLPTLDTLADTPREIPLNTISTFQDNYIEALLLP